jgi:hypothetical protein
MERRFLKIAHRIVSLGHITHAERNNDASVVNVWFVGGDENPGKVSFHNDEARELWRELSANSDDLFPQATEAAGEI